MGRPGITDLSVTEQLEYFNAPVAFAYISGLGTSVKRTCADYSHINLNKEPAVGNGLVVYMVGEYIGQKNGVTSQRLTSWIR